MILQINAYPTPLMSVSREYPATDATLVTDDFDNLPVDDFDNAVTGDNPVL